MILLNQLVSSSVWTAGCAVRETEFWPMDKSVRAKFNFKHSRVALRALTKSEPMPQLQPIYVYFRSKKCVALL